MIHDDDAQLDALLQQPERIVQAKRVVPGLLEETSVEGLQQIATALISTQAAGAALKEARQHRELSLRAAGEVTGRSAPRVKAIEATDLDIHLGTVVGHAQALGYSVQLTLTPLDGQGPTVQAKLTPGAQSQTEIGTLQGETRIKAKVRAKR